MVELTLVPKKPNLRKVKLNSKQCRIYKILLNNKFEAKFDYYDLTQHIIPPETTQQFTTGQFADFHRDAVLEGDPDAAGGNLSMSTGGVEIYNRKGFIACISEREFLLSR